MSAKATTGIGNTINVSDYRNCVVRIGTANSANLTLKCQGAVWVMPNYQTPPDFGSAQTATNNWDFIQMIDLEDGAKIDGDVGFVVTWTDDFRLFEVNINSLDFLNFNVTARSAGNVTVDVILTNNE